ncbi:MAG: glycine betaine ABC transporter substrate-binding protein [Dehalococcoidia bacterium]|nr:glycine betaine ABC transporter substrate-binding protein [Dehalococcoidia bacterium]
MRRTIFIHKLRLRLILMAAIVSIMAMACGGGEGPATTVPKPTIKLADRQWESIWLNNAIAKFVIEKGYGYPVETVQVSTPVMTVSLAKGDIDVELELWQQNIIDWYNRETVAGNVINLGLTFEEGPQFWIIPKWVAEQYNIKTIEDMKRPEVAKLFKDPEDPNKGAFINCVIGWQCAENNEVKMQGYGLDKYYNIITPGSSAALDAALAGAQRKHQPVFGYYWAPTWLMGAYEWQILEEPPFTEECWNKINAASNDKSLRPISGACAYASQPVEKGIHKGMLKKAPDVVEMLKKMNVGLEPINKTLAWAKETDVQRWDKVAIYYLKTYEARWKTWMPEENYTKVKTALEKAGA